MKTYIHLVGKKEGFRTLLAILQMEDDKSVFILTDSKKRAKIISRKLELNDIENSLYQHQKARIVVSYLFSEQDNVAVLLVYPAFFHDYQTFCLALEQWQKSSFKKIIVLLPEKLSSFYTNTALQIEYQFIDENSLPEDKSDGLTFVSQE